MTVKSLIEALATMPPDARVWHLWDGELRSEIEWVWLTKRGDVATSDTRMVCYSTESRPVWAPDAKVEPYWQTPEKHDGGSA